MDYWGSVARRVRESVRTRGTMSEPSSLAPLMDWIPGVSHRLESPLHLEPVCDAFQRVSEGETINIALSVPPRHWKSSTIHHGIVWLMKQIPGLKVAYLTYSHDFAQKQSRKIQRIALRAGLKRGEKWTSEEWYTDSGSMLIAKGLIGGVTGEGFDLIIVDDPYRNRADAESRATRERIKESFVADVLTRQDNTPCSYIVLHTRWHVDDLIGNITDSGFLDGEYPFEWLNMPAVNDNGEALCPKYWPVERLRPFMARGYEWMSQFQGNPQPRGMACFEQPLTCSIRDVPDVGVRAIGVDLAYTAKTKSDWSVAIAMIRAVVPVHNPASGETPMATRYYVVDVLRRQAQAGDFASELQRFFGRHRAPARMYCSTTERGTTDLMRSLGSMNIDGRLATADKMVRAGPVSAAWNSLQVVVPNDAPWSEAFLREVTAFTGLNDPSDDQVDALAAAFDLLEEGGSFSGGITSQRTIGGGLTSGARRGSAYG